MLFSVLTAELRHIEAVVGAAGREQLVVTAVLDDRTVFHHEDGVGVANRREPVRDDEGSPIGSQGRHRLLHKHLGTGVDRRGRLVEDEQRRVGQEGSGDGDELSLTGGDAASVGVDDRVVAVGKLPDESVDHRRLRRSDDFLIGGVETTVTDVLRDRSFEQPRILEHHAHMRPQIGTTELPDIDAVEDDPAAR